MHSELIRKIASDSVIDSAYDWLCDRRKEYPHNDDIWDLRFRWAEIKPSLQKTLLAGEYTFSPQVKIRMQDRTIELWSAQDALVLRAMAIVLGEHLAPVLSRNCYHLKGHGGAKAAVRATLLKQGISRGCPLSPLMGAIYLKRLDDHMKETGLFYARFMDDWVVIAPTRWKLREAVRIVNETLNCLRVEKHPAKTFIGKVDRGFDFLGYFLKPGMLNVAISTLKRFAQRISRLYEQGAVSVRVWEYVRNWLKWVSAGLPDVLFGGNNRDRQNFNKSCLSLLTSIYTYSG